MAKLRHIAITVPDPDATATFYENTFGLERVYKSNFGVLMSDGTVSLAILRFPNDETAGDERGKDFFGLHHMGFVVDDIDEARFAVRHIARLDRERIMTVTRQRFSADRMIDDYEAAYARLVDETDDLAGSSRAAVAGLARRRAKERLVPVVDVSR